MIKLRDYQEKIIRQLQDKMLAGANRLLVVAPTGSGKTVLAVRMLRGVSAKGRKALFVVHRRELIRQSVEAFEAGGVDCGIIASGFPFVAGFNIYVCSIQTLIKRTHLLKDINLAIWDEAHHMKAASWDRVYKFLGDKTWHIGLTATPTRLDGKGLHEYFDEIVCGPSVEELIETGSLSRYVYYAPDQKIQLSGVKIVAGDYSKGGLEEAVNVPSITGSAVNEYMKKAYGKRFLVFAVSVLHSQNIVEEFYRRGIEAMHIDAKTSTRERDGAVAALARGDIKVISNVGLFGEGVDIPVLDGISILRPTKSLSLHLQMCGRCLRPAKDKDRAVILDHAGNFLEHGFPSDDRRDEWSLEDRKKREIKKSITTCDKCHGVMHSAERKCPYCGHPNISDTSRRGSDGPVLLEGTLEEVDPKERRRKRLKEQSQAKDLQGLIELGIRRGYTNPRAWATHVHMARQMKKKR